jgi:hypothetical protein
MFQKKADPPASRPASIKANLPESKPNNPSQKAPYLNGNLIMPVSNLPNLRGNQIV